MFLLSRARKSYEQRPIILPPFSPPAISPREILNENRIPMISLARMIRGFLRKSYSRECREPSDPHYQYSTRDLAKEKRDPVYNASRFDVT